MSAAHKGSKEMNFELDLLPVISMMSVCICFLLLTAVWSQIGSVDIEQGLGQELSKPENATESPSLWVTMKRGQVEFSIKDAPKNIGPVADRKFNGGQIDWSGIDQQALALKQAIPGLKTALIMPDAGVNYGDVIHLMDRLKAQNISEIGLAPL